MSRRQGSPEPERDPDDQVIHDAQAQQLELDEPTQVEEPDEDEELVNLLKWPGRKMWKGVLCECMCLAY